MNSVYEKILLVAESLIQSRGYNAFSYKDIAQSIDVKTSSIHYHFPTKADLGKAVLIRHIEKLYGVLEAIKNNELLTTPKKLALFFDTVVAATYDAQRKMCLGGILASEILTLPEIVQLEVRIFFKRIEEWLVLLLVSGAARGEFNRKLDPQKTATLILSLLEGALLLARLFQNGESLSQAKQHILSYVEGISQEK